MLLLSIMLLGLAGGGAGISRHAPCKALKISGVADWTMLANKKWLELRRFPHSEFGYNCVTREYSPKQNWMRWTETNGPGGPVIQMYNYSFKVYPDRQLFKLTKGSGSAFQQILDTDNYTWALTHVCYES
ncbi:hypothetical protein HPB47_022284, partial [Ixodes persulcatus]